MARTRKSEGGSGAGFAILVVIALIIKFFWWIVAAAAVVGAFYLRAYHSAGQRCQACRP